MSSLSLDGVSVRYGRHEVVREFSDHLVAGEWLGLIGPNGAGKSSLLSAVVGLVSYSGSIRIGAQSLDGLGRHRRARMVAYVPQNPVIPSDMTGFEYTLLGRSAFVGYFGSETRTDRYLAAQTLERLGLSQFADRRMGTLSGGERQRLVIARALATEAPVLVLDEPTSALDIGHQQQSLELVATLRAEHGLTVISAMHDLTLAGMYSDRLVLLHEGIAVASGSVAEVLRPETLAEFYGVRVTVHHDPDGTVVVIPRRHDLAADLHSDGAER